jgi:hypothetical protein
LKSLLEDLTGIFIINRIIILVNYIS